MIVTANRLRSIGWVVLLALCGAVVLALSFRVNALRSQVHRAEQRIVALKQEKMYLETEFETRANQQQLKSWNDIEFGLASLSKPADPDAPAPIRVASADDSVIASAAFPAMVSPLTGKSAQAEEAIAQTDAPAAHVDHATATAALGERLGTVGRSRHAEGAAPAAKKKAAKTVGAKTVDKAGSAKASASRSASAAGKPRSVTARKEGRISR
ncbi:MAG: hypothetical protein ABT11_12965 [Novosphingobium sp. SCN 66-18]|nr:MAG: hypothetical protein ABT11_12965 [Novosphingobium sp. SCN 66-18]